MTDALNPQHALERRMMEVEVLVRAMRLMGADEGTRDALQDLLEESVITMFDVFYKFHKQ